MSKTFDEIIKSRRAVRNYTDEKVKKEDVEKIIEAGVWAPSAMGKQPIRFFVVSNKDKLKQGESIFYNSPQVIFIFTDTQGKEASHMDFLDVGLCSMNMENKAKELGFDTCTIGFSIFAVPKINKIVGADEKLAFGIGITLGKAKETPKNDRRKAIIKYVE